MWATTCCPPRKFRTSFGQSIRHCVICASPRAHRTRIAEAGDSRTAVRHARVHRLPGGRQEAEDAEAPPAHDLQHDAGRIPGAVGAAGRLSDGGAELRGAALGLRQADRPRAKTAGGRKGGCAEGAIDTRPARRSAGPATRDSGARPAKRPGAAMYRAHLRLRSVATRLRCYCRSRCTGRPSTRTRHRRVLMSPLSSKLSWPSTVSKHLAVDRRGDLGGVGRVRLGRRLGPDLERGVGVEGVAFRVVLVCA